MILSIVLPVSKGQSLIVLALVDTSYEGAFQEVLQPAMELAPNGQRIRYSGHGWPRCT